jgi:hypothetical protein
MMPLRMNKFRDMFKWCTVVLFLMLFLTVEASPTPALSPTLVPRSPAPHGLASIYRRTTSSFWPEDQATTSATSSMTTIIVLGTSHIFWSQIPLPIGTVFPSTFSFSQHLPIDMIANLVTVVMFVVVLPCIGGVLYWIGAPLLCCFLCCCPSKQENNVIVQREHVQAVNNQVVIVEVNEPYRPNPPMGFTNRPGEMPGIQPYRPPPNYEHPPPHEQPKHTDNPSAP